MRTRPLGTTGLRPSELGFGCAGFWARSVFSERAAIRLVHRALDLGITFFDTSPHYVDGDAERRLGAALRTTRSDDVIVATKAGSLIGPDGRAEQDFTPAVVRASVEASLGRLGLDHVGLVQLHSPSASDLTDDLLDCLSTMRASGMIGACGVSGYDPDVLALVESTDVLSTTMFGYSVVEADRSVEIDRLAASGTGFIASAPLAHGRIRRRQPLRRRLADAAMLARDVGGHRATMRRAAAFRFVGDVPGWSAAEVAIAYVLGNRHVSTAVFGTIDEQHLAQNVAACERHLPADVVERIEAAAAR